MKGAVILLGLLTLVLLFLTISFRSDDGGEPMTIGNMAALLIEAIGFATAFSVPYLHIAYNRDKRITKDATMSTVATFVSFLAVYGYIEYTGIFEGLFQE
jgi:hypothetical protein